ncbi:MAG: phytanoyl-CoA dioxygenase family protein [Planctomycetia bacterium]|nr:phytanoyl-CoA dioxygenase family protein [Planctomycetia bacterium]
MDQKGIKQAFDRDGFVIVRQFLTADELGKLTAQLDRYIRDVVPGLPDTHAFYHDRARPETLKQMQFMQVDSFLKDYTQHPKWRELAEILVGESAECESPEWFNKPPGVEHPTPPHQDNYYFNLKPPNVVTIWLALDHVDDENGCLRYSPGSHLRGFRPHARSKVLGFSQGISDYGPADEAAEAKIHLVPGDAVAHHGMTIHRAEPNRSPTRNRRAFAMVFKGVSCRRDEASFARYQEAAKKQHNEFGLKTAT